MELKDFVAQTLSDIAHGIKLAQDATSSLPRCMISPTHWIDNEVAKKNSEHHRCYTNDFLERVHFDIAVTTSLQGQAEGKAKVYVADASLNAEVEHSNCTRVSFDVFVSWPRSEER